MRIENIADNEHFEYKGDVHVLGNIGKNATVIIKDGSLTVDGDVCERSNIRMQSTVAASGSVVISGGSIFMGGGSVIAIGGAQSSDVSIHGSVGSKVRVATRNANITVDGNIGNNANLTTSNGAIRAADIGNDSVLVSSNGNINVAQVNLCAALKTSNGSISATDVSDGATLNTSNGEISAADVGEGATLKTSNANISVRRAHPAASLKTSNGEIYENGVPRKTERPAASSSTVFAGGSVFMSVGNVRVGGRVIVNGVDITDIVSGRAGTQPAQAQEEQPVRYMKKGM